MAVVKLGKPVKSNLGGPNGAMAYIIDPAKTDGGRLVSSNYERIGTDYDALAAPMLEDNRKSPKGIRKNSRLAYHIKMSFSPDDPVTPELVHQLGVEFARRITGGEYRFVVATHTDRHHLHDHIMVCAASRYGKHLKAELPKDIIEQWRARTNQDGQANATRTRSLRSAVMACRWRKSTRPRRARASRTGCAS